MSWGCCDVSGSESFRGRVYDLEMASTTDDYVDNTIANLKIIGMLQRNTKLCVRKGQLSLDACSTFQPLVRWVSRDSRDLTLMHIRNTLGSAMRISKGLLSDQMRTDMREWTLHRLLSEMRNCVTGMENLRVTYASDSLTVASLDVMIDRLRAHGDELDRVLFPAPQGGKSSGHPPLAVASGNWTGTGDTPEVPSEDEAAAASTADSVKGVTGTGEGKKKNEKNEDHPSLRQRPH